MNIEAMTEIILGAQNFADNANVDKESLSALFQTFDTDDNGLIDTLEFLAALALVSGLFDSVDFFSMKFFCLSNQFCCRSTCNKCSLLNCSTFQLFLSNGLHADIPGHYHYCSICCYS